MSCASSEPDDHEERNRSEQGEAALELCHGGGDSDDGPQDSASIKNVRVR